MSWLYTIVFAGLLLSSNGEKAVEHTTAPEPSAATVKTQDETEKFEQSYPLNANGRVSVSNVNGSIVVEAWDRNEVRLEATKIADSKESLADVDIRVNSRPDYFSVEADYDTLKREGDRGWKNNRKLEVQFRLSVPRGAVLNEVETVNGSVTVSNFVNNTKVSAVNGNVTANNLRGAANLSTVNGEVQADFDRLESGSRINLSTVNGRVSLVIPSDSHATVKADSLNGAITNDFGLPVRKGEYVGRDLYGRIGSGDVQIRLNSVNGPLAIGRKNDGRTPNPAVNLLPQKKAGDDTDWDDDNDNDNESLVDAMKVDREVAKSVRDAQAQIKSSVKSANKEMLKIKPTLEKLEKVKIMDAEKIKEAVEARAALDTQVTIDAKVFTRLRDAFWNGPLIERKRNTFTVKGTPNVVVDAKGCAVKVRGWDRADVQYVVTEFAGRRENQAVSVTEDAKDSSVNIKVVNPSPDSTGDGRWEDTDRVRVEIFVPRKANLKIMTDREIRVDGVTGEIDLRGGDGEINVRDSNGKMSVSASDGQVRVIGFKGDLTSQTSDGDVFLEGEFASINARAGSGDVYLSVCSATNALITSNTEVESDGVELKQKGQKSYSLGTGGAKYTFTFADGQLVVRDAAMLASY